MGNFMPCNPRGSHRAFKYERKLIAPDPAIPIHHKSSMDELATLMDQKADQPLIHISNMQDLYPKIQNQIHPETIQPTNHINIFTETPTDEKDLKLENIRLTTIISAHTLDQLQDSITCNYATETTTDTATETDSDYNDSFDEKQSEKRTVSDTLSNLYRENSDNPWSSDEIEDLHHEMSQQLVDLTKQLINEEIHQVHKQHSLNSPIFVPSNVSYNNSDDITLPNSKLFCEALIEKRKKEME
eukprot:UN10061